MSIVAAELDMMRAMDAADLFTGSIGEEDSAELQRFKSLAQSLSERLHAHLGIYYGVYTQDSAHLGEIDLSKFRKPEYALENLQLRISRSDSLAAFWEHETYVNDDVKHLIDSVLHDHKYTRVSDTALYLPYDGQNVECDCRTWMDRFFDFVVRR